MALSVPARHQRFGTTAVTLAAALAQMGYCHSAFAQSSVTPEMDKAIMAEIQAHSETMSNLSYLCDDIGARLTGSPQLTHATDWAASRMKDYGLTNVHLEPYTIPEGWERGIATAKIITPANNLKLTVAAFAWTPSTNGPIRGPIIRFAPTSVADLEKYKGKLKDAIVLMNPPSQPGNLMPSNADESSVDALFNDRPARPRSASTAPAAPPPRASRQEMRTLRMQINTFLQSEGIGAVITGSSKPMGLLTMNGSWRRPRPAGANANQAERRYPTVMASNDSYALLYRLAQDPAHPVATSGDTTPAVIEMDLESKTIPGPITVNNVVGDLPGSDKADEFVVLGGHLDSWDLAQGATDNGTGACTTLECARTLVKLGIKPRRTIRFILFTGEEEGDVGSTAYVRAHPADMAKTSMCMVDDAGTGRAIGVHTQAWTALPALFKSESAASLADLGFTKIVPGSPIPGGGGGSDHDSFEEAGVPGFILDQLDANYHLIHHSQEDTVDKADPDALVQTAEVMSILGLRVADYPTLLPRDKPADAGE